MNSINIRRLCCNTFALECQETYESILHLRDEMSIAPLADPGGFLCEKHDVERNRRWRTSFLMNEVELYCG